MRLRDVSNIGEAVEDRPAVHRRLSFGRLVGSSAQLTLLLVLSHGSAAPIGTDLFDRTVPKLYV
jgi:hypothetical protein